MASPEARNPSNTNRGSGRQFAAFGIAAHPTRALQHSICYDFVSSHRWCPYGSQCIRIHPLQKKQYVAAAMQERAQFERMKAHQAKSEGRESQNRPLTTGQNKTSSLPAKPSSSSESKACQSNPSRQISKDSVSQSSSSGDVRDWDTVVGSSPKQRSRSGSTSSSSGTKYGSASDWEASTDASAWTDPNETPEEKEAFRRDMQERIRLGLLYIWDDVPKENAKQSSPNAPATAISRPRPRNSEVCKKWGRGKCDLGYDCKYTHLDLEYDDDDPSTPPPPAVKGPDYHDTIIHNHIRFRVSSGFVVENLRTGFESTIVFVANLPPYTQDATIKRLLATYGEVVDIRRPTVPATQASLSVKVEFAKAEDAYKAFTTLHGARHFGRKLELRMALEAMPNGSVIKDNIVRIDWEYAHRTVYMGYASQTLAEAAVERARTVLYDGKYQTFAALHRGIPAVGEVTVKFDYLPPDVTKESMKVFGDHQGMVTARPQYMDYNLQENMAGIERNVKYFHATSIEFRPSPYKMGKMRAWASFPTPKDAAQVAREIDGRKPRYVGLTRLSAKHIKTIDFSLGTLRFQKAACDIHALSERIRRQRPGYSLTISYRATHVALSLSGEDIRTLGWLKSQVERAFNGQLLLMDGRVAWDDWFKTPSGASYLRDLEIQASVLTIDRDCVRRAIRLFGPWAVRDWVSQTICYKVEQLQKHSWVDIYLDSKLTTNVSLCKLDEWKEKYGADNIDLDSWKRILRVRANDDTLLEISDEVNALRQSTIYLSPEKKKLKHECVVCFNEASPPIHLTCRHTYCRGCLKQYLADAVNHKSFPLCCLANKCEDRVSLALAKQLLSSDSFNAVVEAAFSAHVQSHPNEFHFCPTPDCKQIYRPAKEGVFIQCPSCLIRICPHCDSDAHDGMTCGEAGNGDDLFQEWAGQRDLKQCPGCKIGIEKNSGCNHVQCVVCQTHFCWVCSQVFPNSNDCYDHMRSIHGGIGLVDD
ncbi:hypothetical protein BDN70DRAFT_223442 [Pholiota conissans]|uniref:Uncharacterized protein n=1 Tax=Pholiota conissans TaxID=109636 RepID=A0A9P5YTV7_9AGAR|nr:hypothetical protein BDN70DRAFT_223442 [Pholiota conissans]